MPDEPPADYSDLERLLNELDRAQLTTAIETLETCVEIPDDPDVIAENMQDLDYTLLAETAQTLDEAFHVVHDPIMRSKNQFVDHIQVASKNLFLITDPMFDRRNPDDALTMDQATRVALQLYTRNELIRQRAAIQSAHRELTRIVARLDSKQSALDATTSHTTILDRILSVFIRLGVLDDNRLIGQSPQPTQQASSPSKQPSNAESDEIEPLDVDESELIWGDPSATNPQNWVDDRELPESE